MPKRSPEDAAGGALPPAPARPPLGAPLVGLTFHLVGPGRVGTSLGGWLRAAGAQALAVAGRDAGRVEALAGEWRARPLELAATGPLDAPPADLLLIAVADGALAEIAATLAGRLETRVALHTAGALGASVLAPLRAAGAAVGSCHPLKAFPAVLPEPAAARDVVFALDGDPEAQALARRLAAAWHGVAVEVPEPARRLYHAAATLAAGGVTTLLGAVWRLAEQAGLPLEVGRGYLALARGAVERAATLPHPADAITGPIARGDLASSLASLAAIAELDAEVGRLARELGVETLRLLRDRGRWSADLAVLERALTTCEPPSVS